MPSPLVLSADLLRGRDHGAGPGDGSPGQPVWRRRVRRGIPRLPALVDPVL